MSDHAEKPPELAIAEQLRRIEELQRLHSLALYTILGGTTAPQWLIGMLESEVSH